jgi:hypothetical protein
MCIAGIVTSIERYYEPVYRKNETGEFTQTSLYVAERAGLGFVVPIERAFTQDLDDL